MYYTSIHPNWDKTNPAKSLIFILIIAVVGFYLIGPFIGVLVVMPFYPGTFEEMIAAITNPVANPDIKMTMFVFQGIATFLGFVAAPFLYGKYYLGLTKYEMLGKEIPSPGPGLLVLVLVIVFMGANSIFIEWNENVKLPESLGGFESWARDFENRARLITGFMTTFDSNSQFLIGLLVIALLPAIGEELVFRGFIQNHLLALTKNAHIAIWVAAFIFSFFHFQFYGFIPRLFLGALFGYLYLWSGNIIYPMIAHFINNGFTLLMIYFYNAGAIDFDIESTQSVPISNVLLSMVVSAVLLYLFYSYFRKKAANEQLENHL